MTRTQTRTTPAFACLAACILVVAVAAQATASTPSSVGKGFGFAYNPAHEITVVGTVQEVVSHPAPGGPFGMHLLIATSGKVVDAHIGPFLSKENREALKPGQLVQITGVNEQLHGKTVLLARQLIFSGRQVTIRNERGFLVRDIPNRRKSAAQPATFGGTQ
jgi:hypothetical protein